MLSTEVHRSRRQMFLWLVTACAALFFCFRGPYRAIYHMGTDFASPYVAGWRFWHGVNPYPQEGFLNLWHTLGAPLSVQLNQSDSSPVYPPLTLVWMAPFCALPWHVAVVLYTVLCATLYIALLLRLGRLLPGKDLRLLLLAYGLAFSPIHAGMATANLSILGFILAAHALLSIRSSPAIAGILVALALCFKPTIGAPAAALLLFFCCWTELAWCISVTGAAAIFSYWKLHAVPGWKEVYSSNVHYLFGPHGVASYYTLADSRFDLLNLEVPLYGMTRSFLLTNLFAYGITAILFAWWAWKFIPLQRLDWAAISSLCLIALLPVYQRNYCAGFVIFAVLWALAKGKESGQARLLLLLSVCFLVPGEALLRSYSSHLPAFLLAPLWKNLLFAYDTWAIVGMIVLVLASRDSAPPSAAATK